MLGHRRVMSAALVAALACGACARSMASVPAAPAAPAAPTGDLFAPFATVAVVSGALPDPTLPRFTSRGQAARAGARSGVEGVVKHYMAPCLGPVRDTRNVFDFFHFFLVCSLTGLAAMPFAAGVGALVGAVQTDDRAADAAPGVVSQALHDADPAAALRDRIAGLAAAAGRPAPLGESDADGVVDIVVEAIGLEVFGTGVAPAVRVMADIRVWLLGPGTEPLRDVRLEWRSTPRSLDAWLSDDGHALRTDLDRMIDELAARIVDEVL
jgi:hypothetical protein